MPGTLLLAQVTLAAASAAQAGEAAVGIAALCDLAMGTSSLEEGPALPTHGGKAIFEGHCFQSPCGVEKAAQEARREAQPRAGATFVDLRGGAESKGHEPVPRVQECLARAGFGEEVETGVDLVGMGSSWPRAMKLYERELLRSLAGGPSTFSDARDPSGSLQAKLGEQGNLLEGKPVCFEKDAEPGVPVPSLSGAALASSGKVSIEDFPESGPLVFGDGRIRERDGPSRDAGARSP
jgi:hypothetical protein